MFKAKFTLVFFIICFWPTGFQLNGQPAYVWRSAMDESLNFVELPRARLVTAGPFEAFMRFDDGFPLASYGSNVVLMDLGQAGVVILDSSARLKLVRDGEERDDINKSSYLSSRKVSELSELLEVRYSWNGSSCFVYVNNELFIEVPRKFGTKILDKVSFGPVPTRLLSVGVGPCRIN